MANQHNAVKREASMLSRYIGLTVSRFTTVILSLLCIAHLSPACVYVALSGIFLPPAIQGVLSGTPNKEPDWQLPLTLKKYHFSYLRFRCEKIAAPVLLLFVIGWQYALSRTELTFFWGLVPAFIFLVNIILRILVTIFFRIYLHRQFMELKQLMD